MKKLDLFLTIGTVLIGAALLLWGPRIDTGDSIGAQYLEGEIVDEAEEVLVVEVDGETHLSEPGIGGEIYEIGDRVVLSVYENPVSGELNYVINDQVRRPAIFAAGLVFLLLVVAVAGWQGFRALLGMAFSFVVLIRLVLPLLMASVTPFLSILLGAVLILPVLFYLSHGVSRKTTVAMISTLITLLLTSLLVVIFTNWANLTGTSSEEAGFLMLGELSASIDFKVILLTGILLSLIGVLDDVCLSQASLVQELKAGKTKHLFKSAMRVGRDHIASLVNTLILVYAGAALPLILLLFEYQEPFFQIMNFEFMAEEILRTLLASMGLVLAVPITTFLAVLWLPEDASSRRCH